MYYYKTIKYAKTLLHVNKKSTSELLRNKEDNYDQDIWEVGWSSRLFSHTSLGSTQSGIIYVIAHAYF